LYIITTAGKHILAYELAWNHHFLESCNLQIHVQTDENEKKGQIKARKSEREEDTTAFVNVVDKYVFIHIFACV